MTSKAPPAPKGVPDTPMPVPVATYTYSDVAQYRRVEKQTVYEWVKTGRIPSPIYEGSTARFTADQFAQICTGLMPKGTYTPAESPRALVGLLGAKAKKKAKKKKVGAQNRHDSSNVNERNINYRTSKPKKAGKGGKK